METIEKSIEVDAPVEEVYSQWTRFEEFPNFMEAVEEVRRTDDTHLHWVAKVAGRRKEWDAEIVETVPDRKVAWRSTSGAPNAGVIQFDSPERNRTVVTLRMEYEPDGAMEVVASSLGLVSSQVESDLRHFRDFIHQRTGGTGSGRREDDRDDGAESGKSSPTI